MCKVREFVIKNEFGIHARPASKFVQIASDYESDVNVHNLTLHIHIMCCQPNTKRYDTKKVSWDCAIRQCKYERIYRIKPNGKNQLRVIRLLQFQIKSDEWGQSQSGIGIGLPEGQHT